MNKKTKTKRKKISLTFKTEVVNGKCPTCEEYTALVGLTNEYYRCVTCGADLEQHVNGKISYLPIIASPTNGTKHFGKEWKKDNG